MRGALLSVTWIGLGWLALAPACAAGQGIVVFVQDQCPACQRMTPALTRLLDAGVRVVRYRATANDPACDALGIRTTPTFVAVGRGGQEVDRIVGVTSETRLRALARQAQSGR